jgi:hypothetical protein
MAVAVALAGACANDGERPPPPVCAGDCGRPPGVSTGFPSQGGAGSEDEGEGGTPARETVSVTGQVELLFDNGRFDTGELFTDTAEVRTTRADGKLETSTWNGSGTEPFLLEDLPAEDTVWFLVTPVNAKANDAAATFEPVVTSHPDAAGRVNADLGLVRDTTIDGIFSTLSLPLQRDDNLAQVVLHLVERGAGSGLTPVVGVSVHADAAADVSYAVSGGYSDVSTETDATGVAVVLNVPAAKWPGALVNVQFSGRKTGGAQVRAVTGAVSLVTLVL